MSYPNDPHRRPNPPQVNPLTQPGEGPGTSQPPGEPRSDIRWNGQSAGPTQPGAFGSPRSPGGFPGQHNGQVGGPGQQPGAPGQQFQPGQQSGGAARPPYSGQPGPGVPAGPTGPAAPAGPGGGAPGTGGPSYPGVPAHPSGPSYPGVPAYPGGASGYPGAAGGGPGYPGAGGGPGYPGAGGGPGYPGGGPGYPGAGGGPGYPGGPTGPAYGGGPAGPGGPQPPRKGKGGLIAGLVIGGFLILALIVGGGIWGVSQLTAAPDPDPAETETTQPTTDPQPSPDTTQAGEIDPEVGIGDCIRQPSGPRLQPIDCEQPHYGQIYAQKQIEGETYPGDSQLDSDARTFCQSGASGALDPAKLSEDYVASFAYPTPETWANAEQRFIHCVVLRADGSDFTEDLLPSS
jgi:hypothetical protein